MPTLTFEDALRYLFPGLMVFIWITIYGSDLIYAANTFDKTAVALGLGILFYSVYRSIVYDHIIIRVLDCAANILGLDTYRAWLKSKFGITSGKAEDLYSAIRPEFDYLNTTEMRQRSALIHFMYQGGLLAFVFYLVAILWRAPPLLPWYVFLALSVVLLFSAGAADIKIDRQICGIIRQSPDKIESIARNGGYASKKPRGK